MRFYSFGTDFKYSLGRIMRQEIYTDAPDGGVRLAFIVETAPAAEKAGRVPGFYQDDEGRPLIVVPAPTLDYQVIIQACHTWMAQQGLPDEPVWFLALPPGKSPDEFLRIRRR
ncbi:MAG: hypothetical protein ACUVWB_00570 [Anaerolineae bacterium]